MRALSVGLLLLTRRRLVGSVGAVGLVGVLALTASACLPSRDAAPAAEVKLPFSDDFNRAELGPRYRKTGGTWSITDQQLTSTGERNIPLWLDVPLTRNVRVEFTTVSRSKAVDTKVEIFGDGVRHESGYIVILGGWGNKITTIARLDEHEPTRVEKRTTWKRGQRYRWKIERTDGKALSLYIDDQLVLTYDDQDALYGERNNKLGFTNWESDVSYDDLKITALP